MSAYGRIFSPMARLKDLVYRSVLRHGAGEHEVGLPSGMDYQVFEVTDLTIPIETDWSAGHQIGSVAEGIPMGHACLMGGYLECAAKGSTLALRLVEHTGTEDGVVLITSPLTNSYFATDSFYGLTGDNGPSNSSPPPTLLSYSVELVTPGATAAPITVVRARAAFLII